MSVVCERAWEDGECLFYRSDDADICCNPSSTCCQVASECVLNAWPTWIAWPIFTISMCRRLKKYMSRYESDKESENLNSMSTRNKIKLYWGMISVFIIGLIDEINNEPTSWLPYCFYGMAAFTFFTLDLCLNGKYLCKKGIDFSGTNQMACTIMVWTICIFAGVFLSALKAIGKASQVGEIINCGINVIISFKWFTTISFGAALFINDIEDIIYWMMKVVCKLEIRGCNDCCIDGDSSSSSNNDTKASDVEMMHTNGTII